MRTETIKRSLLLWLGLFALAFANGALRELLITRFIPEPTAHHLSALTAAVIFGSYVLLTWKWSLISTRREAALVGGLWLVLTILAETFLLNRWLSGLSWEQILPSYNLARGELWPLVLLWIGALPLVARALRGPGHLLGALAGRG